MKRLSNTYRKREFTSRFAEEGSLVFEGRLPREAGALLMQALDRGVEWLFRGQLHRKRLTRDDAKIQDVPLEERRADALAALAKRFLAQPLGENEKILKVEAVDVFVQSRGDETKQ